MENGQLKLENQLCFPVYAASRLIIREYQPFLDKLGITYPQYLVLMVLWEKNGISVNEIANKIILNTNTITPLLKRMESSGIITRERSSRDERKVIVKLTQKGEEMEKLAESIPGAMVDKMTCRSVDITLLAELKEKLNSLVSILNNR